ncbi:PREDICTED: nischarin-like isoform X2 [Amphimedon queenslandica]|uniref:PX domain-containing protein n=1 Tax=Amphimedon queenslandica TaxID=400682 RepID=A0AAN0J976_AMPQE|nr:PREDICTED: nischarin-like isoform X2 [Amphimedon queenslandica]|eukprot:XP_019853590.1 PREDICTED: nischarin-like isoform X2 [Amphimedon queenslandica]
MASLGSYLPDEGRAVWRRDRTPEYTTESKIIRHVVIRGTELKHDPSTHVLYRIDVLTEHAHWYICRRYSEFNELHRKLVRKHKISKDLLPPKKLSGNFEPKLINARRQQLEQYLQKLINSDAQISQSNELLSFLDLPAHDVIQVAQLLAKQLYVLGDKLLEKETPIALTINDLYCITKRLRLPMDLHTSTCSSCSDRSSDLGHLYSFIHQLHSLKVIPPPPPVSVTRMAFEITPFRSLTILKVDCVPLSQVSGLVRVQQQLEKVSVQRSLNTLRELLIDSVEERRTQPPEAKGSLTDSWRLIATAKFTTNRVVIQPWLRLTYLNISYNKLTQIDDSLQVLPVLKELNISHNLLSCLELQYLCLPTLSTLDISFNHICSVTSNKMVLENIKELNMSHNMIADLSHLSSFISLTSLNISSNSLSNCEHFHHLTQLKKLTTLTIKNNPVMMNNASRLILLACFMHKLRMVTIDGSEATVKEQAKIRSLTDRFGSDTDQWPITKRVLSPTHTPSPAPLTPPPVATPTSPPTVHVSWSVESFKRSPSVISDTSPSHSLSTNTSESVDHPLFFDHYPLGRPPSLPPSRDDPDGQSDSPCLDSSPLSLATPPCTPAGGQEVGVVSSITPQMILNALESLSSSQTRSVSPDSLSQALQGFINEHLLTTPPSTPLNEGEEDHPLSSADLILALTATLSAHIDGEGSEGGSAVPSAPVGSPQEGLSELVRLGLQPEDILKALNSLTVARQLVEAKAPGEDNESLLETLTLDESVTAGGDTD